MLSAVVCKIQASKHYIESLQEIKEAISLKVKASAVQLPLNCTLLSGIGIIYSNIVWERRCVYTYATKAGGVTCWGSHMLGEDQSTCISVVADGHSSYMITHFYNGGTSRTL